MHVADQGHIDRAIRRQPGDPAVGEDGRGSLALRPGFELLRRLPHGGIEFLLGELGALDPGGAGDLALQLHLLQLVRPAPLVGNLGEGEHGGLGGHQLVEDPGPVVTNPVAGQLVAHDHGRTQSRFRFQANAGHGMAPSCLASVGKSISRREHRALGFPFRFPARDGPGARRKAAAERASPPPASHSGATRTWPRAQRRGRFRRGMADGGRLSGRGDDGR